MSQFNPMALPQGRTGVALTLKIAASLGATARIGAPRRDSITCAGSAHFCRPRS